MKFNKIKITTSGLRMIEEIYSKVRPEPEVGIFYATKDEFETLSIGVVADV